jgi:predicted AlkP superfamily phosphohydrolase/phosphomutase
VGHDSLYLSENDTGPDDSVHSMNGVFMMSVPGRDLGGKELKGLRIEDIGPTLLKLYGLQYADGADIDGHVIPEVVEACK